METLSDNSDMTKYKVYNFTFKDTKKWDTERF